MCSDCHFNFHQEHRHREGVLAPDQVSEAAEKRRAKRAEDKSRRERQKREHEASGLVHAGKELLGDRDGQGTVQEKVILLEDSSERRSDDQPPVVSEDGRRRTDGG
jgi:hypothetical protein